MGKGHHLFATPFDIGKALVGILGMADDPDVVAKTLADKGYMTGSVRYDSCYCPLARFLSDVAGATWVVNYGNACIYGQEIETEIDLPSVVTAFLHKFDDNRYSYLTAINN